MERGFSQIMSEKPITSITEKSASLLALSVAGSTPAKIFTVEKMFHSLAENMNKPISKDQLEG